MDFRPLALRPILSNSLPFSSKCLVLKMNGYKVTQLFLSYPHIHTASIYFGKNLQNLSINMLLGWVNDFEIYKENHGNSGSSMVFSIYIIFRGSITI